MIALTAEVIVGHNPDLVSLPDLYFKLEETIASPTSSLDDTAQIIQSDPALAARLLRIANSAFYSHPTEINTVNRALMLIGTRQLKELAMATVVIDMFKTTDNAFISMKDFWEHSIACGIACRAIAIYLGKRDYEQYYLSGLFHAIGRLILFTEFPEIAEQTTSLSLEKKIPLFEAENQIMGFNHAHIGHALLKNWNLPIPQQQAVHFQHGPQTDIPMAILPEVIHVADWMVNGLSIGSSGEQYIPPLIDSFWQRLDMPESALGELIDQTDRQYQDVAGLFL
ncbi:MAG: HDOD domain-containing protein [Pseudomonadales bacterium]|nr:HDOD domain-containing protein [Pseudomonadales bacterium]